MKRKTTNQNMAGTLEDLLLFLECGKSDNWKCGGVTEVGLRHFRNITILDCVDFPINEAYPDLGFFGDVSLEDLGGQFDICTLIKAPNDDDEVGARARWQLTRARTVPLKTARGRWKLTTGRLVEVAIAFLKEDATWVAARMYSEQRAGEWVQLPNCNQFTPFGHAPNLGAHANLYERDPKWHDLIQLDMGAAFTLQYCWMVKFQASNLFSVSLPVLPQNLKTIFADRERNETTGRKDALRHWVQRYWRALPGEKALSLQEQVQVIEHLRGKEKFNWQGLEAEILPSQDALKALRLAQAEMPTPRPRRLKVEA